jgi:hypothetical protein
MALSPTELSATVIDNGDTKYVDWPAIFGAVVVSTASTFLLSAFGVAVGLASVSPWTSNPSPTSLSLAAAAWFALCALYGGAVTGYVAGRLRKPVLDSTADERSDRDGFNALIAWGFGLLLSSFLAASVLTSAAGKTTSAIAQTAGPALAEVVKGSTDKASDFVGYYVDRAVRQANAPATPGTANAKPEIARLLTRALANGSLSGEDRTYLDKVVAQAAGIGENDAKARMDQIITDANDAYAKTVQAAKEAADKARKITASIATWFAIISLLAAIMAWYAGIIGGRHRDQKLLV